MDARKSPVTSQEPLKRPWLYYSLLGACAGCVVYGSSQLIVSTLPLTPPSAVRQQQELLWTIKNDLSIASSLDSASVEGLQNKLSAYSQIGKRPEVIDYQQKLARQKLAEKRQPVNTESLWGLALMMCGAGPVVWLLSKRYGGSKKTADTLYHSDE